MRRICRELQLELVGDRLESGLLVELSLLETLNDRPAQFAAHRQPVSGASPGDTAGMDGNRPVQPPAASRKSGSWPPSASSTRQIGGPDEIPVDVTANKNTIEPGIASRQRVVEPAVVLVMSVRYGEARGEASHFRPSWYRVDVRKRRAMVARQGYPRLDITSERTKTLVMGVKITSEEPPMANVIAPHHKRHVYKRVPVGRLIGGHRRRSRPAKSTGRRPQNRVVEHDSRSRRSYCPSSRPNASSRNISPGTETVAPDVSGRLPAQSAGTRC